MPTKEELIEQVTKLKSKVITQRCQLLRINCHNRTMNGKIKTLSDENNRTNKKLEDQYKLCRQLERELKQYRLRGVFGEMCDGQESTN